MGVLAPAMATPRAWALRVSDQRAHEIVDAERTAIGANATAGVDADRSAGCRAHDDYLATHPDQYVVTAHDENPSSSGFSTAGQTAARTSQLTPTEDGWTQSGDPFAEGAPWHEMGLLNPAAGTAFWRGASSGKDCVGVGSTDTFQAAAVLADTTLLAWPGENAVVPAWAVTREGPYSPNRFVGLADDARTGPWIMVFSPLLGASYFPESSCSAPLALMYTLGGPTGPLELRAVVRDSRGPSGELPLLSGGALVVSPSPLVVGAAYVLDVSVNRPDRTCSYNGFSEHENAAQSMLHRTFSAVEPTTISPDFSIAIEGLTVAMDGGSSRSTGSAIVRYEWDDNGDGVTDAGGQQHSITFSAPGQYAVSMTAITADGHSAGASARVTVTRPVAPPTRPDSTTTSAGRALAWSAAVKRARQYATRALHAHSTTVTCRRTGRNAFSCSILVRQAGHRRRTIYIDVYRYRGHLYVRRR
jgi:hypothetical protein